MNQETARKTTRSVLIFDRISLKRNDTKLWLALTRSRNETDRCSSMFASSRQSGTVYKMTPLSLSILLSSHLAVGLFLFWKIIISLSI